MIATGDRLTRRIHIHTHVTSGCVNWWRRSFRYKYLNEARVQIHAAHTKQMPSLPQSPSVPHTCGCPSPSSSSFDRSPRCTWVLCLDDSVRCTQLTGCHRRKIERLRAVVANWQNTKSAYARVFLYFLNYEERCILERTRKGVSSATLDKVPRYEKFSIFRFLNFLFLILIR